MTFLEQELKKIFEPVYPDSTIVGNACYVRISDTIRAKILFTPGIEKYYSALDVIILDIHKGEIDSLVLLFSELLGKKETNDPDYRDGVNPHICFRKGKLLWYAYQPNQQDYSILADSVSRYLNLFMK